MGLKWFRAHLRMNRPSKRSTGTSVAGFYRSMSQFDSDVQLPQPSSISHESNQSKPTIHSVPTSPEPIAYNPMAGLNVRGTEPSNVQDIVSEPMKSWELGNGSQISSNEEPESLDDTASLPRSLPRESIELIRDGSHEGSPRQLIAKSRKMDFKRKKARAPLPRASNSGFGEGGGKFITIDKGRGSDASEIEI